MNQVSNRGPILLAIFSVVIVVYLIRLFFLQVMSEEYALKAEARDLNEETIYPSRGIIYDRNDNIYVKNSPIFEVQFIPNEITIPDTTVLETYLGLTREQIRKRIKKYDDIARYQWQPLATQLSKEAYSRFSEQMWQFEGIKIVARLAREYNYPAGANFLGYINQVDSNEIKRFIAEGDTVNYRYNSGDLIGKLGIERQYEKLLRGKKGKEVILRDVFKRPMGSYANGAYDEPPVSGRDIKLGIDANLQTFGEQLMRNKRGSIVAIEPASGEILAFVSAPCFDPGLLTGRDLGKNYAMLESDPNLPLINRPLSAQYPPGSIFKILQALAAMSNEVIHENTHFSCGGSWFRNKGKPACHGAHGACSLHNGIKHSCNSFFAEVYYSFLNDRRFSDIHDAYQLWYETMSDYGIGRQLGIDIPGEKSGLLPKKEFYDEAYGKKSWGALTIYSNSIGQGEILMTPLQMANTAALIGNRGYYYAPHFLTAIKGPRDQWRSEPYTLHKVPGTAAMYNLVVDAMEDVVVSGTARRARVDSITVCGKTGTVENPAGEDHSVFMAFAPKDKPRIAIAAIVENSGFGGTWAAPICSLMIEMYLRGYIGNPRKLQRILEAEFLKSIAEAGGGNE
ncbi:MAG: penicillin-binding protein 2 [Bacteroidota bacterium]